MICVTSFLSKLIFSQTILYSYITYAIESFFTFRVSMNVCEENLKLQMRERARFRRQCRAYPECLARVPELLEKIVHPIQTIRLLHEGMR